jgi:hypothetical protein
MYEESRDSLKISQTCTRIRSMAKDAPLAFRISGELKRKLQEIAEDEGRSISQICELFLWAGVDYFEDHGPEFLRKVRARHRSS